MYIYFFNAVYEESHFQGIISFPKKVSCFKEILSNIQASFNDKIKDCNEILVETFNFLHEIDE